MVEDDYLSAIGVAPSEFASSSKARKLRELFKRDGIIRIVGAHDGMTAKLVERHNFEGIWASGFEISTSYAVPDASILTMTQFLQAASNMNQAVSIPVVADCDSGFGGVHNVIHAVRSYEAAGIAGIVIEDKVFPKLNSFAEGKQNLVSVDEFVKKIKSAKYAQLTKDFMVFARVESFIAEKDLDEALLRAKSYSKAGADAIFIHSKSKKPDEILEFISHWKEKTPLVICPTKYTSLSFEEIKRLKKVKMVIYANHVIRSAIKSIDRNLGLLSKTNDLKQIENDIATLEEVFSLQGMEKMLKIDRFFGER